MRFSVPVSIPATAYPSCFEDGTFQCWGSALPSFDVSFTITLETYPHFEDDMNWEECQSVIRDADWESDFCDLTLLNAFLLLVLPMCRMAFATWTMRATALMAVWFCLAMKLSSAVLTLLNVAIR